MKVSLEITTICMFSDLLCISLYFIDISHSPLSSVEITDEGTEESRWYRFNDTVVDEFVMNDDALAAECFGGMYKSKATDGSKDNTHNTFDTLLLLYSY